MATTIVGTSPTFGNTFKNTWSIFDLNIDYLISTRDSMPIPTDEDGNNPDFTEANVTFTIINRNENVNSDWVISLYSETNVTTSVNDSLKTANVTAISDDLGNFIIKATNQEGDLLYRKISLFKSKQYTGGAAGGTIQNINLSIQPTDEGVVVGDSRGDNSVDLSSLKISSSQVAAAPYSVIAGGGFNTIGIASDFSTISGGTDNTVTNTSSYTVIGGGSYNTVGGGSSTISGGTGNTATGVFSTIGGGLTNSAPNELSVISGGNNNSTSATHASIGGGSDNSVGGIGGVISGGFTNNITSTYSVICGGEGNTGSGNYSVICGGEGNSSIGTYSTIGGGIGNNSTTQYSTISGGVNNTSSFLGSTVGGGGNNTASGSYSTINGGIDNVSSGVVSAITGGSANTAPGDYSTAAGGNGLFSGSYGQFTCGLHNTSTSRTLDSYVSTEPIFVIGNGTSASTRSDAVTVLKDGSVFMYGLKTGTTQGGAGAAVGELWMDTADASIKLGV